MIIYGKQIFFYVLARHKEQIEELFLAKECDKASFTKIAQSGVKIKKLDFKAAQALAKGGNHQGFLMRVKDFTFTPFHELKKDEFIVMLYGISDVGNIGSIARTAYVFGVKSLLIVGSSVGIEGIIRTSAGAAMDMKITLVQDGLSALNELKQLGFYLYASDKDGKDICSLKTKDKKVLIMGSEGFGLTQKVIKKCDESVGIKMKSEFDSLNVSAAFAILCDRMVNE
ncbi:23S rRNA (guanosine(2251)-2'-O)-methyltransferase RlmB [Campylobacter sp. MIT 12-8780]|uniref:TrmH family RNA methyltransferase n=1 Tax=unclassified Campylobacter TaxID=2593542 RepID=UPI00115ECC5A|nr:MULTISPECIES: RNA methyltransferase [unclassified Campylobacter]NDJ27039.1 RNA methyltransferase [Campylobacter sp. MIT 19-121]TQR41660.1 23S rRNA (guanosine(2251)-2'-O)-methyltransferase RlmB [Campylobacter sp. MIT 12-8780]